jgi:hypothetical protein
LREIGLRTRLLLLVLVAIIVPAVAYWVIPSSGPTVSITNLYNTTLQPGQTVEINITVSDVTDLSSCRVNLAWDPNVLTVTTGGTVGWRDTSTGIRYGIREGPFFKQFTNSTQFLANKVNNVAGNITALYDSITEPGMGATGSGVVMIVNFTCVQSGPVSIRITGPRDGHSSLQSVLGQQISHQDSDGFITIDGPPAAGLWTERWFQIAVGVIIAEIIVVVLTILVIVRWLRTRTSTESEEIAEFALS